MPADDYLWQLNGRLDAVGRPDGAQASGNLMRRLVMIRRQSAATQPSPKFIPIAELMSLADGNWAAILSAAGIPVTALSGRHGRPCPKCGGRDRFAPLRDVELRGAVLCRHCFHRGTYPRPGDGLATLQWWLRVDVSEAARWLSDWLGVSPTNRIRLFSAPAHPIVKSSSGQLASPELTAMAQVMTANMRPSWLAKAGALLGVLPDALACLNVGWSPAHLAMSFPMRDTMGGTIGIRLRCPETARKWAIPGSRAGLFYSINLLNQPRASRLFIAEGPTDTAALLSVGLSVIGVPSAGGSVDLLSGVVRRLAPMEVVVVADSDQAGMEGATRLAKSISKWSQVRTICPPTGIKDARAWVASGADCSTFEEASQQAPLHQDTGAWLFEP